ncbi:STAS domain-containing protein [Thalassobacillus pellis]|uniref:STAS domain-containing protein n=1 Tax=Thalassobacillus pellis TaxID=748008 RepID=UPI0019600785|nr:STAS domain-containing protein [Thalassobacillus pellis]MBM7553373.1 anti-anti-sigma regulatory factor [Thalassobacillus pellis]
MESIGKIPESMQAMDVLTSIGENILIADEDYYISWMNPNAAKLLSAVAPLFGFEKAEDLLGKNMDKFHKRPVYQRELVKSLTKTHRARINIKDQFVADIVVTPISNENAETKGFVVMLMDVTTKAEEERRKDKLIEELSTPLIKIWEKAIAVPLIGELERERADRLITYLLQECADTEIEYALLDLSGLTSIDQETGHYLGQLIESVKLIGTECIIVGVGPKLAMSFEAFQSKVTTFRNAHAGLEYIINR